MGKTPEMLSTEFYQNFSRFYKEIQQKAGYKSLLSYSGELSQGFSYALATKLEHILESENVGKGLVKRIFSIFIEALQNVRLHAYKNAEGILVGIAVVRTQDDFEIHVCNLLEEQKREKLINKINELNALRPEELKKKYMETMMDGDLSEKGGAGLGILTIAIKSRNPIKYEIQPLEDALHLITFHFNISIK